MVISQSFLTPIQQNYNHVHFITQYSLSLSDFPYQSLRFSYKKHKSRWKIVEEVRAFHPWSHGNISTNFNSHSTKLAPQAQLYIHFQQVDSSSLCEALVMWYQKHKTMSTISCVTRNSSSVGVISLPTD